MIPQTELNTALSIALTQTERQSPDLPAREDLLNIFFQFIAADTLRIVGTNAARAAFIDLEAQHGQPVGSTAALHVDHARHLLTAMPPDGRVSIAVFGPDIMFFSNTGECQSYPLSIVDAPDFGAILRRAGEGQTADLRLDPSYLADAAAVCRTVADEARLMVDGNYAPLYLRPYLEPSRYESIRNVSIAIMYGRP